MTNSSDEPNSPSAPKSGYRQPPHATRFQPGQSGNPKGRPRGSRNFSTDLKATLDKPVQLRQDGRAQKISTQKAALLRLREKALGGDQRALDRLLALAQAHDSDQTTIDEATALEDKAVLQIFVQRVQHGAASPFPAANIDSKSSEEVKAAENSKLQNPDPAGSA